MFDCRYVYLIKTDAYEKSPANLSAFAGLFGFESRARLYAFAVSSLLLRERPLICTGVFFSTSEPSFFFKTIS